MCVYTNVGGGTADEKAIILLRLLNVYFYKIYFKEVLIGAIHLEKNDDLLYMDILIFPEFQRQGFATRVIKDIQNDIFGIKYERIEISIDESNTASRKLFKMQIFHLSAKRMSY